jgi:3-hydroxyisobutyryl-CoA hydrolase
MDLQRDIISPSRQKSKIQSTGISSHQPIFTLRIFAFNEISKIEKALEQESQANSLASEWAHSTLQTLYQRSPTSLHVSLAAMRATADKTRYGTFQHEFELASHFTSHPDFVNGVTARLIKRTEPNWSLPKSALGWSQSRVEEEILSQFSQSPQQSFYMLEEGKRELNLMERGLFKYSLPMEGRVLGMLMKGKLDGSEGEKVKYTRKEFVEFVIGEMLGKAGAERKLNFILDRNTVEDVDGSLMWKFENTAIRS